MITALRARRRRRHTAPARRAATLLAISAAVLSPVALLTPAASATSGGAAALAPAPDAETSPATSTTSSSTEALRQRTVKLTSSQVRSVQRRVRVKADGKVGKGTRRAIRRYQKRKDLKQTGRPNVETLRALGLKLADKLEAKLIAEAQRDPSAAVPAGDGYPAAIAAAREAIGTPYRYGGTTTAGFDCSGLTVWAMRQAGVSLPRTSFDQYERGVAIEQDQIQAGDLVFFDSAGPGASHVGIATGPSKVISSTSSGVMEHPIATGYWGSHYVGARRI